MSSGVAYAARAYAQMKGRPCPGGKGHEGGHSASEFCDECILQALATAFNDGMAQVAEGGVREDRKHG